MKNPIILCLFFVAVSSSVFACTEDGVLRASPNAMAITTAFLGIADQLLTDLPSLIQQVAQFPSAAQEDATELEQGMQAAAKLVGAAKQAMIQELFVEGVNLTILVTNILNTLILIIAEIGPLAQAIDPNNGGKVNDAMQLTANIMQMISKINIAMKNSIIAGGTVAIPTSAIATPTLDPIPNL